MERIICSFIGSSLNCSEGKQGVIFPWRRPSVSRVPPNKPSKHRKTAKSTSSRSRESATTSGSSVTRSEQPERRDEEIRSTERPLTLTDPTQTAENQDN